jgi:hypothetical protein
MRIESHFFLSTIATISQSKKLGGIYRYVVGILITMLQIIN